MSMTFLHLSDLHLAPPGQLVVGIDPMRQLQSVLARIARLAVAPAFIVVSGDLTEDGSAAGYAVVNDVLSELAGTGRPGPPRPRQPRRPRDVPAGRAGRGALRRPGAVLL